MAKKKTDEKPLCYVIGPIGAPDSEIRRDADMLYHSIIEHAVADKYALLRADKEHKAGMITDMIIQRVHDAEVVIADLTTLNPNAFYELGIRHAANKATIHVAQTGTALPFDTAGYSTIFYDIASWDSHEIARQELTKQLKEIQDTKYSPSNPVTQALTMKVFNASPDSEEKAIAELNRRIQRLEARTNSVLHKKSASEELMEDKYRYRMGKLYTLVVRALSETGVAALTTDIMQMVVQNVFPDEQYQYFTSILNSDAIDDKKQLLSTELKQLSRT